ncbi:hypothetical protein MMC14_010537 [Varicellaria rhodocarpa]|nr:hypothetical protein [Varicellaria rhodocarpa]
MAKLIPEFKHTPVEAIPSIVEGLHATFESQKTKPIDFRLVQLRRLYWGLRDNEAAICEALKRDIGRSAFEAFAGEIEWCKNDIIFMCDHLEKWTKDEKPADVPLLNSILGARIRKEPLGCVLIIGIGNNCFDQKWDKIFYTGSVNVAKIIAKKAAETLTPYTLELGGRNPAIISKNANLRIAARRLLWAKFFNAELPRAMNEFYPDGARASPDYVRIVSQRHWERLKAIINSSKGTILLGGAMDEAERFMEPTVIQVNNIKDSLVADETFGPIITIFPVKDLGKAIRIANDVHRTPLAAFPFGTKQETDQILDNVRSGGASVNDGWIHGTIPTLAFGGIGDSGTGVYRGRASFECFTHRRSVTTTPAWAERVLGRLISIGREKSSLA